MKKLFIFFISLFFMVGMSPVADAAFIDTFDGNEWNYKDVGGDPLYLEDLELDLDFLGKYDVDEGSYDPDGETFGFIIFDDWKSGTWWADFDVDYYTVKGGNQFALYSLEDFIPGDIYEWSTEYLMNNGGNIAALSHLSLWGNGNGNGNGGEIPNNPVPEPATVILLSSGLLGLAVFRRRMKR